MVVWPNVRYLRGHLTRVSTSGDGIKSKVEKSQAVKSLAKKIRLGGIEHSSELTTRHSN